MTPDPITPEDFRAMRAELGVSQGQLAATMGFTSKQAIANYEGARQAHGPVALAMRLLTDRHRAAQLAAITYRHQPESG